MNGPILWDIAGDLQTIVNTAAESFTSVWTSAEGLTSALPKLLSGPTI